MWQLEEGGGKGKAAEGGRQKAGCAVQAGAVKHLCGSDTWAVPGEGELEKRGQGALGRGVPNYHGAAGMLKCSQLLWSIFVIFSCSLKLLGLVSVWKLQLHAHSPQPMAGISGWQPLRHGKGEYSGASRGHQPFSGAVKLGRALKFSTLLPQTLCCRCSPDPTPPPPTAWL